MRVFRFLVVVCGILLLLTACNRDGAGEGGESSSARSVAREGKSSGDAMMAHSEASESSRRSSARSSAVSSARSSARSAQSSRFTASSARSSAKAPFFSLQSSSVASAMVVDLMEHSASGMTIGVIGQSSSAAAPSVVTAGRLKVHLDADRGEIRPGDQVSYIVTVKNLSERSVRGADVVFSFSPAQLSILETDGTVLSGKIQWMVDDLQPNQKRALRVRATAMEGLTHGETIRAGAVATLDGVVEPQTGFSNVTVIQHLPATGAGDFTGPLENTRRFLTPFRGSGAIPAIVWGATLAMGLALGGRAMRRFL